MTTVGWTQRIEAAFAESLAAAHQTITAEPDVQAWLHEASFEAAMGLQMV